MIKEVQNKVKLIDFGFDTKLFSPAATYFDKHGKYPDDIDWWKEQKKRLKTGYEVNGWKITGEHYGYLNFNKIKLTDDEDLLDGKITKRKKVIEKTLVFPKFWDGDYVMYWVKYIAKNSMDEDEYLKLKLPIKIRVYEDEDGIKYVGGGKNLCIGKKRRFGASYKLAYSKAHNYELKPNSMSILAAYDMKYLTKDGIMTKTRRAIDFFDTHCPPFRKRRIVNEPEDILSGLKENIGGVEVQKGYLSRVSAISFGNNADAIRGQDILDIDFEESGKAPNLIAATNSTIDALTDGQSKSGTITWFGTGGGKDDNWEGFKEIFYNPEKFGALEIENEWDEGAEGTYCGLFIPDYWNVIGYMSPFGESYIELAKEAEEKYQYDTYTSKGDSFGLIARKMEHPFCPMDAFAISINNMFDVASLKEWKNHVERNRLDRLGNTGILVRDGNGKLRFDLDTNLQALNDYPIKKGKDNTGCLVVWESPYKPTGIVAENMYIIDVDTYRHAETTGSSVGAIYVYMQPNNIHFSGGDKLVAAYVGRPKNPDDFVKVIFDLAEFYNAKIGFENDEPGGIVEYAKTHRLLHRLEEQFELAFEEKVKTKEGMNRKFGMHMGSGKDNLRIEYGDGYLKTWLESPRRINEDGSLTYNYQTITDIGLLEELIKYNPDNVKKKKGNYDRISAMRVLMYHRKEAVYKNITARVREQRKGFFATRLYK